MVDPLSYFTFQPVLHDGCNKRRGMCYPICGMVHIKEALLLIGKSSRWRQQVSEWSFTICPTFPSFLPLPTLKFLLYASTIIQIKKTCRKIFYNMFYIYITASAKVFL